MGCGCSEREKPILEAETKSEAKPEAKKGESAGKKQKKPAEKTTKVGSAAKVKSSPEGPPPGKGRERKSSKVNATSPKEHQSRREGGKPPQKESIKRLIEPFTSLYSTSQSLYSGDKFRVVKGVLISSQQECVLKLLPKKKSGKLIRENSQSAETAAVWKKVEHPLLPRIYQVAQDETFFYIASEPISGTALSAYLARNHTMTEKQAANVLFQLLSFLQTIHSLSISHQKLTTASIIIQEGDLLPIKVLCPADLDGKLDSPSVRTFPFEAPEGTIAEFAPQGDIWACGVILYYMLSGTSPFSQEQFTEFAQTSKNPKIDFSAKHWNVVSATAKTLVSLMLARDPAARLSALQCQANEWIQANRPRADVTAKSLRRTMTNLKQVKALSPLKAAIIKFIIGRVMAGTEVATISATFNQLDVDGNGSLTAEEILHGLRQIMPGQKAEEAKNKIMTFGDKDGSGMISYSEFLLSAIDEKEVFSTTNLTRAFNTLDQDGSGFITAIELKRALFENNSHESEKAWLGMTKSLAILEDGKISYAEFEGFMRKACSSKHY